MVRCVLTPDGFPPLGINMFLPSVGEISDTVFWYVEQAYFFAGVALGIETIINCKQNNDRQ